MQPVRQLNKDYSRILSRRYKHLPQAFRLLFFLRIKGYTVKLGYAVHQRRNFASKFFFNICIFIRSIFYYIVQQARLNSRGVHIKLHKNHSDVGGMRYIGLARSALLGAMRILSEIIGSLYIDAILFIITFLCFFQQLFLHTSHSLRRKIL